MARRKKLPSEPFEIDIDALLENGRGAGTHDGKALQVYDALPGERVRARYLFGRRFRGQAQALEVLDSADERVDPRCAHFGTCSACSLQHLDPRAQIRFKEKLLLERLNAAGVGPERVLEPLQGDLWHYRRKARLSVRYVEGKGRVLVGFRERDGRFVTDTQECHVLPRRVAGRLPRLCRLIGAMEAKATIPQIEVTCGDAGCALVFRNLEPLSESDSALLSEFARETGLAVLLQPGGPDSVTALQPAEPALAYELPEFELSYTFQPQDFIQVNHALNRLMIRQALELLDPRADETVLDLFCGLGNFTLPLARRARSVVGLEGDAGLVERAGQNAADNGISNVRFAQADLHAEGGPETLAGQAFDKVLLDPPRSGAGPALGAIADTGAVRVLYVSCNPVTLAGDAAGLVEGYGFRLVAAGVMDMFPHTTHVESMALLERR